MKATFWVVCWISIFLSLQVDEASGQLAPRTLTTMTCPDGWWPLESSCIWFSAEKASWINAAMWCRMMGSRLVELPGPLNNKLQSKLIMFGYRQFKKPGKHWIGLSDIENEGAFIWMQSKSPDPFRSTRDQFKNCVFMEEKGQWKAEACISQMQFICEK